MGDLERAWHPIEGELRLAGALLTGMAELNNLFPNRRQGAQEGTIGDATHRAEGTGSDHNPNYAGVVRAWDIDCTGNDFDAQKLANGLAALMRSGHPAFAGTGYIIFNRKITSWKPWGQWAPYAGSDPHTQHIHVSVSESYPNYDNHQPWNLAGLFKIQQPVAVHTPPRLEDDELPIKIVYGQYQFVLMQGHLLRFADPKCVTSLVAGLKGVGTSMPVWDITGDATQWRLLCDTYGSPRS